MEITVEFELTFIWLGNCFTDATSYLKQAKSFMRDTIWQSALEAKEGLSHD